MSSLESAGGDQTPSVPATELAKSLQQLLAPYLRDGCPSLDMAAEIAGMSSRTLQRRLAKAGLSFSVLVDRVRLEVAAGLLTQTDTTSLDASLATGYQDPSNFARFFRRMAGCSPREYRHQPVARKLPL